MKRNLEGELHLPNKLQWIRTGKNIFTRLEQPRNLQYTGYVGDGDSEYVSAVKAMKTYGEQIINKCECVGHVHKRMGSTLRKLKSSGGRTKPSDSKTIGGSGRLTDELIDKLQVYYGEYNKKEQISIDDMRKEISAGLYHSLSTDEKPQHQDLAKAIFDELKPVTDKTLQLKE